MAYYIEQKSLTFQATFSGGVLKFMQTIFAVPVTGNYTIDGCEFNGNAAGYGFAVQMSGGGPYTAPSLLLTLTLPSGGTPKQEHYPIPIVEHASDNGLADIYRLDVSGTWTLTFDAYLMYDETRPTDGSGNPIWMPTFGGSTGGTVDPPTYRNKFLYYAYKPGGSISSVLTVGDNTLSYSGTLGSTLTGANLGMSGSVYVQNLYQRASRTGPVVTKDWPGEAQTALLALVCNGAAVTAPGYAYASGGGSVTGALSAAITAANSTPGLGHTSSVDISGSPQRTFVLNGAIAALNRPYPATIGLKVDEAANALAQPIDASNGAFSVTHTQHQYILNASCDSTADPSPPSVNEFAPVRCWLRPGSSGDGDTHSLLALGEDTTDWRVMLHGMTWNAMTLQQAASVNVDASPSPSNWTAGANTTLGSGLSITVSSAGAGSVSSTLAAAAPSSLKGSIFAGVSFLGYRTLRLNLTADAANQPARIKIGSKQWDVTVGTSGYVEIDLCCPTNAAVASDGTDTTWPFNSPSSVTLVDGPLWGVSNVSSLSLENLAAGHVYTLSGVSLQRKAHSYLTCLPARPGWVNNVPPVTSGGVTTTTQVRRGFQGNTDGRQSIELEDVVWTHVTSSGTPTDSYGDVPILGIVHALQAGVGNMPSNGWTAVDSLPAPTTGCTGSILPLRDCGLNSGAPSAYLYGGGLLFGANAGVSYGSDIDCTGSAASIPAQELFDELTDWVPCGDVFGFGPPSPPADGTIYLCAGKILDGDSWGILHKAGGSARNVKVRLTKSGTGDDGGVGLSDRYGEYRQGDKAANGKGYAGTGTPFAKGLQTYAVTAAAGVTPPSLSEAFAARRRQRVSFFVVPVDTCCGRLLCSDPFFFPFAPQAGDHTRLPLDDWRAIPDVVSTSEEEEDRKQEKLVTAAK